MSFGQVEIRAFGVGMAAHTGVTVQFASGSPRTDGKTVWMDDSDCASLLEYELRTGTADHEIAHVWFGSVLRIVGESWGESWADRIAKNAGYPALTWAAHECINVALDIHDETRMELLLPHTADAIRRGNIHGMKRLIETAMERQAQRSDAPLWRVQLLMGLLAARIPLGRDPTTNCYVLNRTDRRAVRSWVKSLLGGSVAGRTIRRTCMACREKRRPHTPKRTRSEWGRIYARAERLFQMIADQIKPEDQMPDGNQGVPGMPKGGMNANQRNDGAKRIREANIVAAGGGVPDGDPLGGQASGQQAPTGPPHSSPAQKGEPGGGCADKAAVIEQTKMETASPFYAACNRTLGAAMAEMMETEDSMRLCHYRESGATLGKRWVNAFTNGRAFVVKDKARGAELNLALLLDRSGSMSHILNECAAACASIANVATEHGAEVQTWLFGDTCDWVDWRTLVKQCWCQGGTKGAKAMRDATAWLLGQPSGRKLCIVITDGDWYDVSSARAALLNGARSGVEYVFIGLGMQKDDLTRKWPMGLRAIGCPADAGKLAANLLAVAGPAR